MNGRLNEISGLLAIVVKREMDRIVALPQREFNRDLNEGKAVLAVARGQNLSAKEAVSGIQNKLQKADQSNPVFGAQQRRW